MLGTTTHISELLNFYKSGPRGTRSVRKFVHSKYLSVTVALQKKTFSTMQLYLSPKPTKADGTIPMLLPATDATLFFCPIRDQYRFSQVQGIIGNGAILWLAHVSPESDASWNTDYIHTLNER